MTVGGPDPFDVAEPPYGDSGWQPTPAQRRAILLGALGVVAAVLTHRVDLLVLATPMLVVATWGAAARPRHTVQADARIGNRNAPEGAATGWSLRLRLPVGAEQATLRLAASAFAQPVPVAGPELTRPADGADLELVVPARLTRVGSPARRAGLAARSFRVVGLPDPAHPGRRLHHLRDPRHRRVQRGRRSPTAGARGAASGRPRRRRNGIRDDPPVRAR